MKRVLGVGVCAAIAAGGLCANAAPAAACPSGTVPSDFAGVCVSGPSGGAATPPSGHSGAMFSGGVNSLPSVNGIPCTPEHIGTCIGLFQSQG